VVIVLTTCANVLPDLAEPSIFTSAKHYRCVANRNDATSLPCGMFDATTMVFDIRNCQRPNEIACIHPAHLRTSPGPKHQTYADFEPGQADWCSTQGNLASEYGGSRPLGQWSAEVEGQEQSLVAREFEPAIEGAELRRRSII
jgi:hypothetical protein